MLTITCTVNLVRLLQVYWPLQVYHMIAENTSSMTKLYAQHHWFITVKTHHIILSLALSQHAWLRNYRDSSVKSHCIQLYLGPFHGAIAVPSVTRCRRCRRCCGHRCAGGVQQWRRATVATPGKWQCKTGGVQRFAVANGPNIFQMLLVYHGGCCDTQP